MHIPGSRHDNQPSHYPTTIELAYMASRAMHVAYIGDKIEFHLYPSTPSVVQAAFDKPCELSGDTAFFSGGVTTQAVMSGKRVR